MADTDRMTMEEVVKRVLLDEHEDVIREPVVRMIAYQSDVLYSRFGEQYVGVG